VRRAIRAELPVPHPTAGLICVGLRDVLVAFNVHCVGPLHEAQAVARELRAMPGIRALAFELASRGEVQLSMNLVDIDRTGPARAFDAASEVAAHHSLRVVDAEVVGLVPDRIRDELGGIPLRWPVRTIEDRLHLGTI
jgi:glutamate formiminotransferase